MNADVLGRLKPGAMFINTARAEVVDYDALDAAVRDRGLRVGLDVFRNEPAGGTGHYADPLVQAPGVYGTHHIGASTEQAQEAIAAETVRIVRSFKDTGQVPNVVNLARRTPATHRLVVRHRNRPGVLAHVFDHLRAAHINVQETENIIFEGAQAAVARINLDGAAVRRRRGDDRIGQRRHHQRADRENRERRRAEGQGLKAIADARPTPARNSGRQSRGCRVIVVFNVDHLAPPRVTVTTRRCPGPEQP